MMKNIILIHAQCQYVTPSNKNYILVMIPPSMQKVQASNLSEGSEVFLLGFSVQNC